MTTLNLQFVGPTTSAGQQFQLYPRFTDQSSFLWSPVEPISNSKWCGRFGDPVKVLPQTYLNIVVMNSLSSYTWAWPSTTGSTLNSFSMPTGNITLQSMMNNIYTASRANITSDQYQDITGQPPADPTSNCTVANALITNATALQYNEQFFGLLLEGTNIIRVLC